MGVVAAGRIAGRQILVLVMPVVAIGGLQRLPAEAIEQIHQHQLLVLLLVLQSQLHQLPPGAIGVIRQQGLQGLVHPLSPGRDIGHWWPAEQAALRPWLARPDRVVIGIEQEAPAGIRRDVARLIGLQHEGFEEPGGVGQVPFGRTGIGHALQVEILRFQRRDQGFAGMTHLHQSIQEGASGHGMESSPGDPREIPGGFQRDTALSIGQLCSPIRDRHVAG